jgi:D-3-phosphoglycerate dehydrogenase
MTDPPHPRLLVALRPDAEVAETIARELPRVLWTFARSPEKAPWDQVEAILVGSVDRELGPFEASSTPRLRLVQLIYTGADRFPFGRFPESVEIAPNVGAYAPFVAEHAIMLALASAREVVPAQAQVRAMTLRPPPKTRLLLGRTAVVLGYGAIGRELAKRLAGFDLRIVGVNRSGRMAPGCSAMYSADRLREAVAEGDLVFDVRPLTRATERTIGTPELEAMKPNAIYVNVGRAATADEEALYRHLVARPEFRAAFDPWWDEDFPNGTFRTRFPLLGLPNFLGSPHSAGFGPATQQYALACALQNLRRFFNGEPPLYRVDRRDYVSPAGSAERAPGPSLSGSARARTSR